jgi:TrmH family RNA methyltransferase
LYDHDVTRTVVSSRQHRLVRLCRDAAAQRGTDRYVLLDGEHLLEEALGARIEIEAVLTDRLDRPVIQRACGQGIPVHEATAEVLAAASPARTSSGIVTLAAWTTPALTDALAPRPHVLAIALLAVQDPGNVGSAIRSVHALGGTAVVACEGTADPRGWKALRGAMGSTFHLPVARASIADTLAEARRQRVAVAAAVPSGGMPLEEAPLTQPLLVLAGNEGAGLAPEMISQADMTITIPMSSRVGSINVAVSVALIAWEGRRQRQRSATPPSRPRP